MPRMWTVSSPSRDVWSGCNGPIDLSSLPTMILDNSLVSCIQFCFVILLFWGWIFLDLISSRSISFSVIYRALNIVNPIPPGMTDNLN